jgi:hypothetical protein
LYLVLAPPALLGTAATMHNKSRHAERFGVAT